MSLTRSDVDYIDDPHSAGRAWLELHHELNSPGIAPGRRTEAKAAMNKLNNVWPDAEHHAVHASEDELGGLPPHLKHTRDAHRKQVGVTAQDARRSRQRGDHPLQAEGRRLAKSRPRAPVTGRARIKPAKPGRSSGPSASGVVDWAAPGAVDLAGFGWQVFGWGVGLSMAYLLLTNAERAPRGRSALELVARGASHTVNALVQPLTDPLSPRRT